MNFGFIIPTCCKTDIHINQLLRCISSITKFHPNNKILLINDSDEKYNLMKYFNNKNITILKSIKKGSADQQVFKVFLETKPFEIAVFIQDSMLLNKKLENINDIKDIKFIWHFTNHRIHWDKIKEPINDFNKLNNIITHKDLIKYCINNDYKYNQNFIQFSNYMLDNMDKWCGSIGSCCIINIEALLKIIEKINFIDIFCEYTSNRLRRVNESIFPIICHYIFPEINFENSYDGLYYDGKVLNKFSGKPTCFDNLNWCCKNTYFSKISFNR